MTSSQRRTRRWSRFIKGAGDKEKGCERYAKLVGQSAYFVGMSTVQYVNHVKLNVFLFCSG